MSRDGSTSENGHADAVVLFGATGDLARKKLFPGLYGLARRGRLGIPVIGVARSSWDDESLREHVRDAITAQFGSVDERAFNALSGSLSFLQGDYQAPETFE